MKLPNIEWSDPFAEIDPTDPHDYLNTALRDLFALGCYLHLNGELIAGNKAIDTALRATGLHKTNKNEFQKIMKSIDGNERFYLNKVSCHTEINDLFTNT